MNKRHMINYHIETIRFKNDIVVGGNLNEYTGALAIVILNNMKQLKINESKTTYSPPSVIVVG